MASVRKKGRYEAHDLLDEFLLNQVAKYVKYLQLNTFARDLGIRQEDYDRITAPNTFTQDRQILEVSNISVSSLPYWFKAGFFASWVCDRKIFMSIENTTGV